MGETGTQLSAQTTDLREYRRFRAWELRQEGWTQQRIADALGVTQGAVSQWLKQAREGGGPQALRRRKAPGAQPRLTPEQFAHIPELLKRGAEAHGFRGDVWTRERVGKVIEREFGVSYHPTHVGRILRDLGWTQQKPVERASQRNEAAIQRWRDARWPELQKKPKQKDTA
jgi:transposase